MSFQLDSPASERFKPQRSRSTFSLNIKGRATSRGNSERRCLTSRRDSTSSSSSAHSSVVTSSSSDSLSQSRSHSFSKKRNSEPYNDENLPPAFKMKYTAAADNLMRRSSMDALASSFGSGCSVAGSDADNNLFTRYNNNTSAATAVSPRDYDQDNDFLFATDEIKQETPTQFDTPVKGLAELSLRSPIAPPESPFARQVRAPPPDSPYIRVQRSSSCLDFRTRHETPAPESMDTCPVEADYPSEDYVPFLPLLPKSSSLLNCISSQTVADLVNGVYNHRYTRIFVIDCRFDYEFDGGHIRGAINCPTLEKVDELFTTVQPTSEMCFVFHCEFSSKRGPNGYTRIRSEDRLKNLNRYPHLDFPEMYLLDGGYKAFFEQFQHLCDPNCYVPMREEAHREALITSQGAYKKKPPANNNIRKFLSKSCSNIFEGISVEDNEPLFSSPKKSHSEPFRHSLPENRYYPQHHQQHQQHQEQDQQQHHQHAAPKRRYLSECQDFY